MTERNPILELHRVTLEDEDSPVLADVSLTIYESEIVGLVFNHGVGKTSLLRIAAGLTEPTAGEVVYLGRRLREYSHGERPPFGFVFANGGLLENLTVEDNVALPLRYHTTMANEVIAEKVAVALEQAGAAELATRFPWQLTRDRQRLASLARALVGDPRIVFVDDYFLGADAEAFHRLQDGIVASRDSSGASFVLVLKATPDDFGCTDRLCLIDHGAVLESRKDEL